MSRFDLKQIQNIVLIFKNIVLIFKNIILFYINIIYLGLIYSTYNLSHVL